MASQNEILNKLSDLSDKFLAFDERIKKIEEKMENEKIESKSNSLRKPSQAAFNEFDRSEIQGLKAVLALHSQGKPSN